MTNNDSYPYQLPIDKVLTQLDKVKPKQSTKDGLNQWQALCPSHGDKSPSLTITECADSTVLLKCWTGCTASEIVRAIGLELKDLFKYEPIHKQSNSKNSNQPVKKLPSKRAIAYEQLIIQIAEAQINKGLTLSTVDKQRYQQALNRLNHLKGLSYVK